MFSVEFTLPLSSIFRLQAQWSEAKTTRNNPTWVNVATVNVAHAVACHESLTKDLTKVEHKKYEIRPLKFTVSTIRS